MLVLINCITPVENNDDDQLTANSLLGECASSWHITIWPLDSLGTLDKSALFVLVGPDKSDCSRDPGGWLSHYRRRLSSVLFIFNLIYYVHLVRVVGPSQCDHSLVPFHSLVTRTTRLDAVQIELNEPSEESKRTEFKF